MSEYRPWLESAITAARQAGTLLREEFHRTGGPRGGQGHALVDDEAGALICDLLRPLGPGLLCEDPHLAEPGTDPAHVWLIDPNDGTSAFLKGWRGNAVSIALVREGVPVLGVVYACTYPDSGAGDLIAWAEGCRLTRNGRELPLPSLAAASLDQPGALPRIVFVSQSADTDSETNAECVRPARFVAQASIAYRLARVAVGEGLAALSLHGPRDWDYAAGHALLRAVGGTLVDERGREITYTTEGTSQSGACFGGAPSVVRELALRNWRAIRSNPPPQPPMALVWPVKGHVVAESGMLARAQGCLLGQLCGDSLGGLVEFQGQAVIQSRYPRGVRQLLDGGTWGILAGQPTDDSEMALMLARTLAHRGRYDPGEALESYLHWWNHAWDRGGNLTRALDPARHGATTEEKVDLAHRHANSSESGQSNGSLMRISPLGIFAAGRPKTGADWARQDSRLTHPHSVCQDACAVFITAIAHTIARGDGPEAAYQAALTEAERPEVQQAVRDALQRARTAPPDDYQSRMGWVLIALQNAFYQLLHAPTLEAGIVMTVESGGDTDTNGAIAGALLGAVHGRDALPVPWILAIQSCRPLESSGTNHPMPQEFWPVDALMLAEALLLARSAREE